MSDRYNSNKAAFNRPSSGWTEGNCVEVFCIRHIAQNFTKKIQEYNSEKGPRQHG